MIIARCKKCGMHYPVDENVKEKKCPKCKIAAEDFMDYPTYKKGLNKRIITTSLMTCGLITLFGFFLMGFVFHWSISIYTVGGLVAGIFYALNQERASLAEIAAAVRAEAAEDSEDD